MWSYQAWGDGTKYILIGAYSRLMPEADSAEAEEESQAAVVTLAKMSVLQVWRHTARDAVCFRTTPKNGPKWDTVVFRRSYNEDTGELLEETLDPQHTAKWKLYQRIPGGPVHLRTELWWEDNEHYPRHCEPVGEPAPCLLYTSPSPRDRTRSRMPSSA